MTKFEDLGIKTSILEGLAKLGFDKTFPIQEAAIPVLLSGRDVVGQAHTGSGKTAAFGISMLQKIEKGMGIQGLVMAPTRELANQISDEIKKFGKFTGIKVVTIYGGQSMGIQLDALRKNPEIIVATPGRLIDHINRGTIALENISHMVLDEADTMLDMGFIDDIKFVLQLTPDEKTMSLFSATMPVDILRLAEEYLKDAKQFLLDADDLSGEGIDQSFLVIKDRDKPKYLFDFIKENGGKQCIVFCSTKYRTRDVAHMIKKEYETVIIEGDMSQNKREASMSRFRQGKAEVLVATDVASRGIDVPRVSLVVNYDVPNQDMTYFHRIGRTARAGAKGRAITLVSYSSIGDFNMIKRQIKVDLRDLNKEMGIEITIPDPLKRDVSPRRYGAYSRGNREKRGFSGQRGSRGGGSFRRDDRSSGGFRSGGGSSFKRDDRSSGGFRRDDRNSGGSSFRRDDRSGGSSFKRDDRSSGFRSGGGSSFRRDDRSSGGFRRDDRNSGGSSFRRDDRSGGSNSFRRDDRNSGPKRDGEKINSYRNQNRDGDSRDQRGGSKFGDKKPYDNKKKYNGLRSRW